MGHHSDQPFDGDPEALRRLFEMKAASASKEDVLRKLMDTTSFRGEIGAFPEGRLTPHDEGAIQFAVGEQDGKVVMDFGKPVQWIGMKPQDAADLAGSLMKAARAAGRRQGETITLMIG